MRVKDTCRFHFMDSSDFEQLLRQFPQVKRAITVVAKLREQRGFAASTRASGDCLEEMYWEQMNQLTDSDVREFARCQQSIADSDAGGRQHRNSLASGHSGTADMTDVSLPTPAALMSRLKRVVSALPGSQRDVLSFAARRSDADRESRSRQSSRMLSSALPRWMSSGGSQQMPPASPAASSSGHAASSAADESSEASSAAQVVGR